MLGRIGNCRTGSIVKAISTAKCPRFARTCNSTCKEPKFNPRAFIAAAMGSEKKLDQVVPQCHRILRESRDCSPMARKQTLLRCARTADDQQAVTRSIPTAPRGPSGWCAMRYAQCSRKHERNPRWFSAQSAARVFAPTV